MSDGRYLIKYREWLESPYLNEEEKCELRALSDKDIYEAFYKDIEFGTAGMRGKMRPGTNGFNTHTVRMAAKGTAELLGRGSCVAVAFDTRNGSERFAEEAAKVLASCGIKVYLFDGPSPVPLLSFTVRELGCDGGIVITASHNSKEYNGFKTYTGAGVQMDPDMTDRIAAVMKSLDDPLAIVPAGIDDENIEMIGDEVRERFVDSVLKCSLFGDAASKRDLKVVYTPLYGSGRDLVISTLKKDGFKDVIPVESQCMYNGDFPGLEKPNPELQSVFYEAEKLAEKHGADIMIATDPDSDRVGVGIRTFEGFRYLSGNQTGALLVDFLSSVKRGRRRTLVTTVVTGELGSDIAKKRGCRVLKTLTGSKYVCSRLDGLTDTQFLMGYEESYGYVVGRHVRDKDGISAAMLICEMAAFHKKNNTTLTDRLTELWREFGYYADGQDSISYEGSEGAAKIERLMEVMRSEGEKYFGELGSLSEIMDFEEGQDGLPPSNVMKFVFEGGSWIAARPSGTEPNIKIYYCIRGRDEKDAEGRLSAAQTRVKDILKSV